MPNTGQRISEPVAIELSKMYSRVRGVNYSTIRNHQALWDTYCRMRSYMAYLGEVGWTKSAIATGAGMAVNGITEYLKKGYDTVDVADLPDWQPESLTNRGRPATW